MHIYAFLSVKYFDIWNQRNRFCWPPETIFPPHFRSFTTWKTPFYSPFPTPSVYRKAFIVTSQRRSRPAEQAFSWCGKAFPVSWKSPFRIIITHIFRYWDRQSTDCQSIATSPQNSRICGRISIAVRKPRSRGVVDVWLCKANLELHKYSISRNAGVRHILRQDTTRDDTYHWNIFRSFTTVIHWYKKMSYTADAQLFWYTVSSSHRLCLRLFIISHTLLYKSVFIQHYTHNISLIYRNGKYEHTVRKCHNAHKHETAYLCSG